MLKTKIKSKKKKLERLEIVINFVVVVMVIQFSRGTCAAIVTKNLGELLKLHVAFMYMRRFMPMASAINAIKHKTKK
jgi:hypothetical protein